MTLRFALLSLCVSVIALSALSQTIISEPKPLKPVTSKVGASADLEAEVVEQFPLSIQLLVCKPLLKHQADYVFGPKDIKSHLACGGDPATVLWQGKTLAPMGKEVVLATKQSLTVPQMRAESVFDAKTRTYKLKAETHVLEPVEAVQIALQLTGRDKTTLDVSTAVHTTDYIMAEDIVRQGEDKAYVNPRPIVRQRQMVGSGSLTSVRPAIISGETWLITPNAAHRDGVFPVDERLWLEVSLEK